MYPFSFTQTVPYGAGVNADLRILATVYAVAALTQPNVGEPLISRARTLSLLYSGKIVLHNKYGH